MKKNTYRSKQREKSSKYPLVLLETGIKRVKCELLELHPEQECLIIKIYKQFGRSTSIQIVKRIVCYARVSTKSQVDDLERQVDFFRSRFPTYEVVADIGYGINWKRKGLSSLLEQSIQGTLKEIVVAHRDRLSRIAFDLLEHIFNLHGTQIVVLDHSHEESSEQELAQDIMSIVHVYSCKAMGKRRYTKSNQEKQKKECSKQEQ